MKSGIIYEANRYSVEEEWRDRFELYNFSISTEQLSFFQIFYSAFATPARYVMELFRRLHILGDGNYTDGCFVFNPFVVLTLQEMQSAFRTLSAIDRVDAPLVVADRRNFPIGYYLPSWVTLEEERYLTLLSTVNATLDQNLLNRLFFTDAVIRIVADDVQSHPGNGFLINEDLNIIYEWTAATALSLLERVIPLEGTWGPLRSIDNGSGLQLRALRDALPFSAVMPHHAGDVLFYALAAKETTSHISRIVVNRRYASILEEIIPGYGIEQIDPAPPNREGSIASDEQSFIDFAPGLPPFSFYYYCRQVRNYNLTEFNLIDQFGFALGKSFINSNELISLTKQDPPLYRSTIPERPMRVLLHFDAGWELKVYPAHYRQKLINGLQSQGIAITVLGTEERDFGSYRSVKFTDLASLKKLLQSHHLLVGSDSFPSHYAAHVLGVPTICLFGPTKPANSDARLSSHYKYLEIELHCRPCSHVDCCLTHGKPWCSNFVPPDLLLKELFAMLETNYGRK